MGLRVEDVGLRVEGLSTARGDARSDRGYDFSWTRTNPGR